MANLAGSEMFQELCRRVRVNAVMAEFARGVDPTNVELVTEARASMKLLNIVNKMAKEPK